MHPNTLFLKQCLLFLCIGFGTSLAAQDCIGDECLWPGDANRNGISNNMDILWIGLAHQDNTGGPERDGASFTWTPQTPPSNWEGSHPVSGINYKYADTDGSGWIDGGDIGIFPELYGQMNDQFISFLGNEILGDDLYLIVSNPNPAPGEIVEVSIQLGSEANPINDIYGIAFTIDFDTSLVKENETVFTNEGGWMNTAENNLFTFNKQSAGFGLVKPEFAYVSQNGQSVSGFGEICKMYLVIEDVIVGLDGTPVDSVALNLRFKRVLGLNAEEEDMLITIAQTDVMITDTKEISEPIFNINVWYQPEAQKVFIHSDSEIRHVSMINMAGQTIYQRNPNETELEIFTSGVPAGIYLLQIHTKEGVFVRKFALVNNG